MTRQDDSDRLSADDAHILGMESSVITGHTLKLNVIAPGTAPIDIDALRNASSEPTACHAAGRYLGVRTKVGRGGGLRHPRPRATA